ncbi:MAG: hypothetical protein J5367_05580 [Lachnospiraceae bacterium]|nr:hypothetical protein [Lachnospiraceae bacterium]
MFSYILNDFKRAVRSKWAKIYFFGTLGLILLANIAVLCFRVIYGSNEGTFAYNVFEYASWCFLIPYYSCIILAATSYGRDYIRPRKDGIRVDTGRSEKKLAPWQVYVSKLIETIMLAIVFLVIAFVLLYVATLIFHINEGIIKWPIVWLFLKKAFLSLPLWFAGISFAIMFLFLFEQRWMAYMGFATVTFIIPQLIRIFSLDSFGIEPLRMIRRYTITQSFGLVPYPSYPERSVPLIVTIGIVYGVLAIGIGIIGYNKKAK